jgi:DNA-binding transcriptional LysR family regulator
MRPDSRQAELFVAVARHLSFTRAAAELNMPQPWLSAQIRRLEDQLGFKLFQRTSRQVELTPQGAALLGGAQAVTDALSQWGSEIATHKRGLAGAFRIGVALYSKRFRLRVQAVEAFAAANGNLMIEIESGWSPFLRERVLAGALDVAFSIGGVPEAGLESRFVESHAAQLYLPADDPLAALDRIPVERLRGRTVLTFPRATNPALYDAIYQTLGEHGAELKRLPETDMDICIRDILKTGSTTIGFALPAPPNSRIAIRPIDPEPPPFELYLVRREGAQSALVRTFWNSVFPQDLLAAAPRRQDYLP